MSARPQEQRETHPFSGPISDDADASYDPTNDPTVRTIGVMGSAGGEMDKRVRERAYDLGVAIAQAGCVLITGACPGLPYDAARGARSVGGLSVGISPALSRSEHVLRYESPVDQYDVIIYTGSGLMGREVDNIHSSDIVIIAGGRSGTLGEFAIAYDEGKLIGILAHSEGIADDLPDIVPRLRKKTGARLVYEADPVKLVAQCIEIYRTDHYKHPSVFSENAGE
ncbi:MAG TPA: hypothetical protein VEJ41_03645, partial [Candidatus Acidoferrales bacterium]|nr:hypothetical protein [Candidatus Acidoferrales bacterium]